MAPKPTVLAERFEFYRLRQTVGEKTQDFLARLRSTALKCKFADLQTRLRDQFVCNIGNSDAREALLEEDEGTLTLEDAYKKTVAIERSKKEAQIMSERTLPRVGETVNAVKPGKSKDKTATCGKCGLVGHKMSDCRTKCFKCKKMGHIRANCGKKSGSGVVVKSNIDHKARQKYSPTKRAYIVEDEEGESYGLSNMDTDDFEIWHCSQQEKKFDYDSQFEKSS